jgi:hypothetical protein
MPNRRRLLQILGKLAALSLAFAIAGYLIHRAQRDAVLAVREPSLPADGPPYAEHPNPEDPSAWSSYLYSSKSLIVPVDETPIVRPPARTVDELLLEGSKSGRLPKFSAPEQPKKQ